VSVEAISWALNLAPVPRDGGGKRNPACKAVLVGLANHAAPDGREAFPSVRTLVRYTDLSERTACQRRERGRAKSRADLAAVVDRPGAVHGLRPPAGAEWFIPSLSGGLGWRVVAVGDLFVLVKRHSRGGRVPVLVGAGA
jgi:hypothetical protein